MGACLSGQVKEHELIIDHGDGANGKTTFYAIVAAAFGDYAIVAPKSLLIWDRHEHHPTDRAVLFRRRLAYAGEIPDGARLHEATVKELTGGDTITARRMREDFWTFQPTHKLHLFANHLPKVSGTDQGIWRRLRVVPWTVTIPDDRQDRELAQRIIDDELAGVFRWLIDGYQMWRAGVAVPDKVTAATRQYRHKEDTVGRFIDDELVLDPEGSITAGNLGLLHQKWSSVVGIADHEVKAHYRRVLTEVEHRGATADKGAKGLRLWRGIRTP
jgi:putative DNA primase/helicase